MKGYGELSDKSKCQICRAVPDNHGGSHLTDGFSVTPNYECIDRQVTCLGVSIAEGEKFNSFMHSEVSDRLNDIEGVNEFESHLRSLPATGFGISNFENLFAAEDSEERGWAIGESIAEAYLEREENVIWPWNKSRDKLASKASLPGADLIGFVEKGREICLVIGEVKTSSQLKYPPDVMNGRSGMVHQIDYLAENLEPIRLALLWLFFRCRGTEYEIKYNAACVSYANSGNKNIALFGVLIRDTNPEELDLKSRGKKLAEILQNPTTCQLTAIYIPCGINDLITLVSGGGS